MSNRKSTPTEPLDETTAVPNSYLSSANRSTDSKSCILLLMVGPKYDLKWEFGDRLAGLSNFAFGHVLTTSSVNGITRLSDFEVHSIDVGNMSRPMTKIRYFLEAMKVVRNQAASGSSVDAIITYDPMFSGFIGLIVSTIWRTKLICEINGDYSSAAIYNHITGGWKRRVRKFIITRLARYVLGKSDGIKLLFDEQLSRLGIKRKDGQQVERFPDFVKVGAFKNLGEERTILLLGFPAYVKGVDIAINAFRQIERDYPEWELVIMGHYPDRHELNALIQKSRQICIQKAVLHRDVVVHVGRCAIMLLPSRSEAMGRALVEAMAAGKPIIATDIDGIPNVVEDGVNGLLIPPNHVAATATALKKLIDDQILRVQYGRAGAEKAQAEFSEAIYFAKYDQFLSAVLSKYT